jgi:uncharacterized membrane protein
MNIYTFMKLLHIVSAFWFIAGILGRQLARSQARRAGNIQDFSTLSDLAARFEELMVIPGNLAVIVLGVVTALLGKWPILGFLQGASQNWLLVCNLILLAGFFLVPLVFLPRGKVFAAMLLEAQQVNRITPELVAALDDPIVRWAHWGELIMIGLVVALMVLKPF